MAHEYDNFKYHGVSKEYQNFDTFFFIRVYTIESLLCSFLLPLSEKYETCIQKKMMI